MKRKTKLSKLLPIYVGVACVITVSIIVIMQNKIANIYANNLPLMAISDNIKNKITKGHLWFEEYVAGDKSINPDRDVISLFISSQKTLEIALKGGGSELGYIYKVEDPNLEHLISISHSRISDFIEITRIRRADNDAIEAADSSVVKANAGSELDQRFDKQYNEIQIMMDSLSTAIKIKVKNDAETVQVWVILSVILVVFIFIFTGTFLSRVQIKNEANEDAINLKIIQDDEYIKQMTAFADSIGQGDYDLNLSSDKNDILSNSLNGMRLKLKAIAEEDKRQNWVNNGLYLMSDLLRKNLDNEKIFYQTFLFEFVKYTKANQSAIFLINGEEHEDKYLRLVACVAYERQKFFNKKINIHDGLLGQAILERELLYLTEIPQDYIKITSGLGDALPSNLVIVPLIYNNEIYGVIEIASFYVLEKHHLAFVEKVVESLASVVSMINTNTRTQYLLQSVQEQTEEMRAQEEEMRQNLEELQATQEELLRKEKHYLSQLNEYRKENE